MSTSFEINWKLAARPERLSTTMRPATKLAVNLERIYRRKRATLVAWLPPVAVSRSVTRSWSWSADRITHLLTSRS